MLKYVKLGKYGNSDRHSLLVNVIVIGGKKNGEKKSDEETTYLKWDWSTATEFVQINEWFC